MPPRDDAGGGSGPASPLRIVRNLAAAEAARYNRTAIQRDRILHRLRQGPATRAELERQCGAASVTKRISELRGHGHAIAREWAEMTTHDGSVIVCALYSLADRGGAAQLSLSFE